LNPVALFQRQRLVGFEDAVFVDGFDRERQNYSSKEKTSGYPG
jgi:hypothetical protein